MIHFKKQSTVNQCALKMSVVSLFNFRCSPWRTTAQILSCIVLLQEWPGTSHSENASWKFQTKKTPYVCTRDSTRDQLEVEYRPLTVDATFDFRPYNVTPTSYQHLIVLRNEDSKHPTMIGPVLLHEKKTQSTYSLFGGTLKSLEPELKNLMAFGTDDEKALVGGFNETFERATCLPYEIHLCKNIDTKLLSMDIKGESKQSVMDDILGRKIGSVFESRLPDAGSAETFFGLFESLEEKWSSLHSNGSLPLLVWLEKHEEFIRSFISPIRQRAGLGFPPDKFTTNRSECTNSVLQDCVNAELPELTNTP